eukprot:scpid83566/ scgid10505/ 
MPLLWQAGDTVVSDRWPYCQLATGGRISLLELFAISSSTGLHGGGYDSALFVQGFVNFTLLFFSLPVLGGESIALYTQGGRDCGQVQGIHESSWKCVSYHIALDKDQCN